MNYPKLDVQKWFTWLIGLVLKDNKQITEIKWYFDHYGPYVEDVYNVAKKGESFFIEKTQSYFGNPKENFRLIQTFKPHFSQLSDKEKEILDDVIEQTKYLNWNEFIKMVYQTYPIENQKKYSFLNLRELKNQM